MFVKPLRIPYIYKDGSHEENLNSFVTKECMLERGMLEGKKAYFTEGSPEK